MYQGSETYIDITAIASCNCIKLMLSETPLVNLFKFLFVDYTSTTIKIDCLIIGLAGMHE